MSTEDDRDKKLIDLINEYNSMIDHTTKVSFTRRRAILSEISKNCKILRKQLLAERQAIPTVPKKKKEKKEP